MHHDPVPLTYISHSIDFVKILRGVLHLNNSVLDLNYVIVLPNAGVISTSAEFLYYHIMDQLCQSDWLNANQ